MKVYREHQIQQRYRYLFFKGNIYFFNCNYFKWTLFFVLFPRNKRYLTIAWTDAFIIKNTWNVIASSVSFILSENRIIVPLCIMALLIISWFKELTTCRNIFSGFLVSAFTQNLLVYLKYYPFLVKTKRETAYSKYWIDLLCLWKWIKK